MKKDWRKRRIYLFIAALAAVIGSLGWSVQEIRASIPDEIYVLKEEPDALDAIIRNPWITTSDTVTASTNGKYTIECKLFDRFLLKQVTVSQAEPVRLSVSGDTIGIYMETDGILVIDTQEILSGKGQSAEPARNLVQPGDYIKSVDGIPISSKKELISRMETSAGEPVTLELARDGRKHSVSVRPAYAQDGSYKLGIWVRDNTQGIGTLTYVKEDGSFGALGHGISDSDMGELLRLNQGDLYRAQVVSITKGSSGSPGELSGVIHYNDGEHLGCIENNAACGIYGKIDEDCLAGLGLRDMDMAYKQEMQTGPASILCSVKGEVCEYQVQIEEIYWDAKETNKCFVLQVTDEKLIEQTGGIVQGMSGAPILQNGKFVGAVTHVFINDPTRGFGIFAEEMMR